MYFVKDNAASECLECLHHGSQPGWRVADFTDLSGTALTTLVFNPDGTILSGGTTAAKRSRDTDLGYAGGVDPLTFPM